jgi:hypothetical protein
VHFGHRDKDQAAAAESDALQAAVDRLKGMSLVAVATELIAKGYTGEPSKDADEPPWVDPFGRGPSAYDAANWLYLPRDQELDTSQPLGEILYGIVSEALQVLEHAALVRTHLQFGYQGSLADAHLTYVLTRYGASVRDAGAVERVLNGGTLSG